jgi:hypothetical protein
MISPAPSSRLQLSVFLRARSRRGLSVIELLAATVISLIVMGATVQLFGTVGNQISNGRSNIELGDRVRSAIERLRRDLRGVTVDMRPWNRPEDASGYLEIIKGGSAYWDKTQSPAASATTPGATLTGYTNDGLFFTTRSRDMPFVGRAVNASGQNITLDSQVAEVAWYLQPTSLTPATVGFTPTIPPTYTLYRRMFLVLPGVATSGPNAVATGTPASIPASQYYDMYNGIPSAGVPLCDISAHPDGTPWPNTNMILNSLADLSYRENRFAHFFAPLCGSSNLWGNNPFGASGSAPFSIVPQMVKPFPSTPATDPNLRYGEDVVLANVLSFDVKVWDPGAPVFKDAKSGNPLVPSDPGFSDAGTPVSYGAYVDLNWNGAPITNPSGAPPCYFAGGYYGAGQKSYMAATSSSTPATYDTWPAGYEFWLYNPNSGAPQTSNQSFNGFDDIGSGNTDGGVDSPTERLTCPPYPVPLRGIQIKIRTYEFTSKQVREVTLQESFVPD